MITESWSKEIEAFVLLESIERSQWLARLAAALTIAARDTYDVGGDGILDPKRMRRFNELLHRTVNQLQHQMRDECGYPDDFFLSMVKDEAAELGVDFLVLKSLM